MHDIKLVVKKHGTILAEIQVKSAWAPLNIHTISSIHSVMAAVGKTGSIVYFVLPVRLRSESSTRPVPKKGDVLLMPQHNAIGIALEDTDPLPYPNTRIGTLTAGLEKLRQLKSGDIVIVDTAPAE